MIVQTPLMLAMPVPICVVSAKRLTVLPAVALPVKVGVVTSVMLSELLMPESLEGIKAGVAGVASAGAMPD